MPENRFPLSGPINLLVRLGSGSVTVTARDGVDTAVVRLTPRNARNTIIDQITVEMRGPTLAVEAPRQNSGLFGWRNDREAVDAEIEVPSGTAMRISTSTAEVTLKGRSGGADVTTGAADVVLDTVDGDLRLRTGSARAHVAAVSGAANVKTGSGDVQIGEVGGALTSGFGSGNLRVSTARASVRSRAGSGNAFIGAAFGDVDVSAGSGQLEVGLPAGTAARLDVHSGSGRVRSDMPIDDAPLGDRQITIRARTGSGDVRVFRAASNDPHDGAA